jgi:uncharacterized protein (TIGR02996 family)
MENDFLRDSAPGRIAANLNDEFDTSNADYRHSNAFTQTCPRLRDESLRPFYNDGMNDHEPFFRAIAAAPEDAAARLIYADWLEERGDERAEFIRLHARLAEQPEDEEFFRLLETERTMRSTIDPLWLRNADYEGAYARLFGADEGIWLDDSQTLLRWGMAFEELSHCAGARYSRNRVHEYEELRWERRQIWRGLSGSLAVRVSSTASNPHRQLATVTMHDGNSSAVPSASSKSPLSLHALSRRFGYPMDIRGDWHVWRFCNMRKSSQSRLFQDMLADGYARYCQRTKASPVLLVTLEFQTSSRLLRCSARLIRPQDRYLHM